MNKNVLQANPEQVFKFVFQHPTSKEVIITNSYNLQEINEIGFDDIFNKIHNCGCYENFGEDQYREGCNCEDYFNEFEHINTLQYSGIKDKNGKRIFTNDIIRVVKLDVEYQTHRGNNIPNGSYTEACGMIVEWINSHVVFKNGGFVAFDESFNLILSNFYFDENYLKEMFLGDNATQEEIEELAMEICDCLDIKFTGMVNFYESINGIEKVGNIYEPSKICFLK